MTTRYLSEDEIKEIRKSTSRMKGTAHLPPDASALDRAKYDLCQEFVIFMRKKCISQRKLAEMLGVPESRISEIVHYRINKLTLDRLVRYMETLRPNLVLKAV
ncbi:MAG: XRE family transcriptional regulator [Bdellovibrionota bacterium]